MKAKDEDDVYQLTHKELLLIFRIRPGITKNPAKPYKLWKDLAKAKANISFGQLIQLAPSIKK